MLAYNGLALITEKLQAQRLEELPATTCSSTPTSSSSSSCPTATQGTPGCVPGKLPQVTPDSSNPRTSLQSNLAVKGKNVWAMCLESERSLRGGPAGGPDVASDTLVRATRSQTMHQQLSVCRHRKPRHTCQSCYDLSHPPHQATLAPPKKKHCRSLSVPPPGDASLPSTSSHAKIWRPIAVIPLHSSTSNNNNNPGSSSMLHHNNNPAASCTSSTSISSVFNNNNILSLEDPHLVQQQHGVGGQQSPPGSQSYQWLPRLSTTSFLAQPPALTSPPSVDSGCMTTGSDFTSDLATPPGSPVPRPSSAISSSDVSSFSSLSSPWLDSCTSRSQRGRVLENRSLSLEDRISGPAHSSLSHASSFHSAGCIDPCPHRSGSSSSGSCTGGGVAGGCGTIPRCHSQPCVLHHRRYGKKRRRDCDTSRPTLNFNKMTETAYTRSSLHHRRSEPWSTPHHMQRQQRGQPDLHDVLTSDLSGSRAAFCLNPIASSPLDPPSLDLIQATASPALPLTPPEQLSPALPPSTHWEMEEIGDGGSGDCGCQTRGPDTDTIGLFPMNDLDLDQIENH